MKSGDKVEVEIEGRIHELRGLTRGKEPNTNIRGFVSIALRIDSAF
jgi:hypothetical protein